MGDAMGGQIDKMVSFIQFEAKNKKEEILAKAKQDKEAKKLEMVHREKLKIDSDFNKRIKNVDTQHKIKLSKDQGEMRMKVLLEADEVCNKLKDDAKVRIQSLSANPATYGPLLESLIMEALIRINERKATIVCRAEDLSLVKQVVGAAKSKFEEEAKNSGLIYMQDVAQGIDVAVHESTFLAPAPVAGSGKKSCCGGVVVLNANNTISCDNTLDARLNIAFEEQLPEIRKRVFGDVAIC